MRLWHESLVPDLCNQHLCGQHRECCALRGGAWNVKHETVNYVFDHEPWRLVEYHFTVLCEMDKRGFDVDDQWCFAPYRGESCEPWDIERYLSSVSDDYRVTRRLWPSVFPEHDRDYLVECVELLRDKGCEIWEDGFDG